MDFDREINAAIGARVRARRKAVGLSQTELGAPLGIEKGQISRIEHGQANVTVGFLKAAAQVLVIPWTVLAGEEEAPPEEIHPRLRRVARDIGFERQASLAALIESGHVVPRLAAA